MKTSSPATNIKEHGYAHLLGSVKHDTLDLVAILKESALTLSILPPTVHAAKVGAAFWANEEALVRVQCFRGRNCETDGLIPLHSDAEDGRYILTDDSMNYHLILSDEAGGIVACLRLRVHTTAVTASDLQLFPAIRRMVHHRISSGYTLAINAALGSSRESMAHCSAEVSGLAISRYYHQHTAIAALPVAALALVQCFGHGIVFAYTASSMSDTPSMLALCGDPVNLNGKPLPAVFDVAYQDFMELVSFDTQRLSGGLGGVVSGMADHIQPLLQSLHLGEPPAGV